MKKLLFVLSLVGIFAFSNVVSAQNTTKVQSQKEVKAEKKSDAKVTTATPEQKKACCDKKGEVKDAKCCNHDKKTEGCNHDKKTKCDPSKCSKTCTEKGSVNKEDKAPVTKDKQK